MYSVSLLNSHLFSIILNMPFLCLVACLDYPDESFVDLCVQEESFSPIASVFGFGISITLPWGTNLLAFISFEILWISVTVSYNFSWNLEGYHPLKYYFLLHFCLCVYRTPIPYVHRCVLWYPMHLWGTLFFYLSIFRKDNYQYICHWAHKLFPLKVQMSSCFLLWIFHFYCL